MKNLITCLTVSVLSGATFADAWGSDDEASADVNGDGIVGVNGLLMVVGAWGECE